VPYKDTFKTVYKERLYITFIIIILVASVLDICNALYPFCIETCLMSLTYAPGGVSVTQTGKKITLIKKWAGPEYEV